MTHQVWIRETLMTASTVTCKSASYNYFVVMQKLPGLFRDKLKYSLYSARYLCKCLCQESICAGFLTDQVNQSKNCPVVHAYQMKNMQTMKGLALLTFVPGYTTLTLG